MPDLVYPGGCLCGAVRYEARGAARFLCFCHCHSCRRAAGAPLVPWATFARSQVEITRGALRQYRSSAGVLRGFCGACGSSLTYYNEARADDLDLSLASLDDPRALAPAMHLWVQDRLPWVSIEDGLPRHAAGLPDAEQP
ncbi:MAG TPA: GFA family protein [Steroidobacteraceae bacterium]|jgi:hypothetical protein